MARPLGQQAVEAAAVFGPRDLLGVGGADRRDMVGVDQPGLEERDAAIELDAVETEGGGRNGEVVEPRSVELALVGEIVDRHDRRRAPAAPTQVAGGERGRPVVEMQQVGPPAVDAAHRQVGRGEAEPGETDRVVGEFCAARHRRRASRRGRRVQSTGRDRRRARRARSARRSSRAGSRRRRAGGRQCRSPPRRATRDDRRAASTRASHPGRSARGSAAEISPRPPAWRKSLDSGVTNSALATASGRAAGAAKSFASRWNRTRLAAGGLGMGSRNVTSAAS